MEMSQGLFKIRDFIKTLGTIYSLQGFYKVPREYIKSLNFQGLSKQVPENFQGLYKLPENSQGLYKLPENSQGLYKLPKNSQGLYKIPENFQGLYKLPENNSQGLYKLPENCQGLCKVSKNNCQGLYKFLNISVFIQNQGPDKTPITRPHAADAATAFNFANRRCRHRILFCKFKVRPWSCWSYPLCCP